MSDALYRRIEERFGFSMPPEYRRMEARGFFSLDRPAVAWEFMTTGDGPLWLNDMEWLSLKEIAEFEFDELYEQRLPHLLPFALNAAGDFWCWQVDKRDVCGTRVLLCPHDYMLAKVYSPNFASALYRQALWWACYDAHPSRIDDDRAFIRRWAIDLAEVFPASWCQTLVDLANRAPFVWESRWKARICENESLLSADELIKIERRDIAFSELDTEIQWLFEES